MSVDAQFDRIEAELEDLRAEVETCARAIVLSRVAIWGGLGILVAAYTAFPALATPTIVFGSFAAIIGGIVWYGANKSTRDDLNARLAEVDTQRAGLFDQVAARNGWRDLTPTIH